MLSKLKQFIFTPLQPGSSGLRVGEEGQVLEKARQRPWPLGRVVTGFILSLMVFCFIFARSADAATLSLVPDKKTVKIGEEISIDVKVDTEGESINAAQGAISFPASLLEAIKIERSSSVFNFWIEEPAFSNENGTANFIGGTSKGVTGKSLQILKLTLKARSAGSAEFSLSDAVVTASDGQGTNILSHVGGTVVSVGTEVIESTPSSTSLPIPPKAPTAAPIQPQKVERKAVPATKLPATPVVKVPLYQDMSQWYNYIGEAIALWEVPLDVIQVATELNQNPNAIPTTTEKELFTGKKFGNLKEGIQYIHVRFKNNIGWGDTAHYKISLDTTAPLPFEAKIDSQASDNPAPQIIFITQDALSGISYALVFIDGKEVLRTATTTTVLPPQALGTYTLLVRVFDRAGNSVEDDLQFEILPLPTPVIEFISRSVSQGETIFASGKSISNGLIEAQVLNTARQEVFKGKASSDNSGNWKVVIDKILPMGKYTLAVVVQDERGASSYSTKEESFKVRPKTILSLGGVIDLGWFEIFIFVMLVVVSGVGLIAWWYVAKKKTHEAYRIIVGRDIEKLSALLSDDLKELEDTQELDDSSRLAQAAALIDKMKKTIAQMKKYIGEEVNKLK
ncbi:MAG: hypothetical protein V1712_03555 [Patescibacteria group bacterium]